MDQEAKKTALRMIPYGLYVLGTTDGESINMAAINWLTQCSFQPPLLAMGVKRDSEAFRLLQQHGVFGLSILGTGQKDLAFAFFKPTQVEGDTVNGYRFERTASGVPLLVDAPAWVEGRVTDIVDRGDHAVIVGEVTNAGVRRETAALTLQECGVHYGG